MPRDAQYDKLPIITTRFSARAMAGKPVSHDTLMALVEAASFAPSCFNEQPWRFLIAQGERWAGKLTDQDGGTPFRGRKLSDSGVKARFYHAVCEAHLNRIIKVDLSSDLFSYTLDDKALDLARMMDGKLLLVTNAPDLSPTDVVARYKSLADIERGFRVLKSELEIGPVYHRLPERIRAHAQICFIALILYRVMRSRLRAADTGLSPERALQQLQRIQHHRVRLNDAEPISGVSSINQQQSEVFSALHVRKPGTPQQLNLL